MNFAKQPTNKNGRFLSVTPLTPLKKGFQPSRDTGSTLGISKVLSHEQLEGCNANVVLFLTFEGVLRGSGMVTKDSNKTHQVLPKYGFEGSPTGVFDMMQQFERGEVLRSEDFQRQGRTGTWWPSQ